MPGISAGHYLAPRTRRGFLAQKLLATICLLGCLPTSVPAQSQIQLRDVTAETGIAFVHTDGSGGQRYIIEYVSTGLVLFDYDGDDYDDIYFLNGAPLKGTEWKGDPPRNALYRNNGDGTFTDVSQESGIGQYATTSMGTDLGDYDNDGLLDLFVTSYGSELSTLYRNLGDGLFEDVTRKTGAGASTLPHVTWGHGLIDFDNDGYRDLFIACGDLDDNVELRKDTTAYALPNILMRNTGDGRFVDVSAESGDGMQVRRSSRGVVFGDLDNDGRMDVVVLNSRAGPTVLRNESPDSNRWLQIHLRGVTANRYGVGARVRVTAGDFVLVDEVHSGRSYQSHFGLRLHFGLGVRDRVDRIEVRWPGGYTEVFEQVPVNRVITLVEGTGN